MYLRTVRAKGIEYLQLAASYRDPITKTPKTKVLYSFGRKDQVDLDALRRLVKSISRFLEPGEVQALQEELDLDWPFEYLGAKKLGGPYLLDALWRKLGIDRTLHNLLEQRGFSTPVERLIFAMVANRALAPSSKLAMEHWVQTEVRIDGLDEVEVHQLYRAMDFLLEAADDIQRDVFFAIANLFNLEVDVIFVDTTTVYFEVEQEDPDTEDAQGLRKWGYSRDKRPELPQAVIGFAVTRRGIPVRCWVWPGNATDQTLVEEVKKDLNGWKLGRVVTVMDTGFNSEQNRRILQGAGDHYIIGEKLRLGPKGEVHEALKRAGTYKKLKEGIEIKEVIVDKGSTAARRFVVVHNPAEAERDKKKRMDIVAEVERRLEALDQLEGEPHTRAACSLRSHPAFGRYIRQTKTGKLRLDKARIKAEERFDGKFLVSASDHRMPAEDVALGYKQLWRIERLNRDLKHTVDLRPVYHRLDDRIRAHVLLCWLALLLIRVAENETEMTWRHIRNELSPLTVGYHRTRSGEVAQTSPLTDGQKEIFAKLDVKPPARYQEIREKPQLTA